MRLSTIFYLYRVRLRARFVQELLAVAGIAVGVALLFASQVANTSLAGSVTHLTDGLIGKSRLQLTAPELQRNAQVIGSNGTESVDLIGVNSRFLSLEGQLLAGISTVQLARQQGLAVPASVAHQVGAGPLRPLRFQVGARSTTTQVAVVLQASDIGQLVASPLVIAPLGLAQSIAGMPGMVSRILVEPRPGS